MADSPVIVAKLCRLSRDVHFISGLMAHRVPFIVTELPKSGMGRFAQGRKSLFDFASSTPGAQRVMLRDQYRSAPDIVDYISSSFYGGKLRVSVDPSGFRVPRSSKPGLSWTHVPGQSYPTRLGNVIGLFYLQRTSFGMTSRIV